MPFVIEELKQNQKYYPRNLNNLAGAPDKLFIRGNKTALHKPPLIAVVGTRKISQYGRTVVKKMIPNWVRTINATIISGLALGTDALVHEETLNANGITVAVLGSGVGNKDIIPRTNYQIAQKILNCSGALLSEYPTNTIVQPYHFPARNRIVAGLADVLVIIEGTLKSGTLITAKYALEYGRDVFAVPGPITQETSAGTNWLIAQGAYPLTKPEDLIEKMNYKVNEIAQSAITLSPTTTLVLNTIKHGSISIDLIVDRTKLDITTTLTAISELELNGLIYRTGELFTVID